MLELTSKYLEQDSKFKTDLDMYGKLEGDVSNI